MRSHARNVSIDRLYFTLEPVSEWNGTIFLADAGERDQYVAIIVC